jgi:predicted TIM-barrel fold metal-dependent hydrolase
MANSLDGLERYLIITSDTHAGAGPSGFGPYIERKWQSDYEDWVKQAEAMAKVMRQAMGERSIGVDGDPEIFDYRNHDSARRLEETDADGVVAEVLFPNTPLPFSPRMMTEFGEAGTGRDHQREWAGVRAYNRWLADFCSQAPGRRAGLAQIFLPLVEESVREIHWARENGLSGVLLPGVPPNSDVDPLYSPAYEPIYAACAELGMPLAHHSGSASPPMDPRIPQSLPIWMLEVTWFTRRAFWHLAFSGVLERNPNLKLVFTEASVDWVPGMLNELDNFFNQMVNNEHCSEYKFGGPLVRALSLKPSEYFARHCYLGASFLRPRDWQNRQQIGADRIMWGSDYPHIEGTYPYTREALRLTFGESDPGEVQQALALTAAEVYGFDLEKLAPLAARFGPTKAEIAQPLKLADVPERARKSVCFLPENQVPPVAA